MRRETTLGRPLALALALAQCCAARVRPTRDKMRTATAAAAAAALTWLLASPLLAEGNVHEARTIPVDPSQHPLFFPAPERHHALPRPRVAIIGGGAGGTSAAFFLKHLGDHDPALAVDVDLFEAEDHLGGRSTTIRPTYSESNDGADQSQRFPPVELGGSIFVEANKVRSLTLSPVAAEWRRERPDLTSWRACIWPRPLCRTS